MIPVQTVLLQLFILLLLPRLDVYHGFSLSTLQASENWQTDWEHTAASVKSLFVGNIEMYESESIEILSCIYVVWLHKKTCLRPVVAIDGFQHTLQSQYTYEESGINYNNSPIWILKRNLFHWDCVPQNSTKLSLFSGWVRSLLFLP